MRSLFRTLTIAILGLTLAAGSARASQVVFGNLGTDGSAELDTGASVNPLSTRWFAIGFTVGGTNTFLETISIGIGGSGSATVGIYTNSGGTPSTLLQSSTQSIVGNSAETATPQSFNFNGFALTSGASYWAVVSGSDNFNWVYSSLGSQSSELNSSGWTALSPFALRTTNSGTNWSTTFATGARSASLSITASSTAPAPEPIPEPGTWAAAALLIGAAAYVRLRRRAQAA